ncbi:MAG TPA: SagB/ThcOx family dehydrogenase [Candidatus Acidoferrales bacterium]|nr:SagB/ThcOx family dehydrogenase [Candidatus Acidoferrales bacterium]
MTRFLSRALDDPQCGILNQDTQRLFDYHQATKHTYHSVRTSAHYLDWRNQPNPFRTFEGAPITVLPPEPGFPNVGTFATMGALSERAEAISENTSVGHEPMRLDAVWLSRLLWHSMAVSAWKKVPGSGSRYSLRVNPSSGNLHPTETYLALRGFSDIGDGLYHYRADLHALELRSEGAWTQQLAQTLSIPWAADARLIVGLTAIFWREAWKYRERAYRYCCHDLGHAMMSILVAARALGLPGGAVAHFSDSRMTRTLGLDGGDEAPMIFLVFPQKSFSAPASVLPQETFAGVPNELSSEEVPYKLLLAMHCATILPDPAGPPPHVAAAAIAANVGGPSLQPEILSDPAHDKGLGVVVRRRRSALDFDPRTSPMDRSGAEQLLDFATRDWSADWHGNFAGDESSPVMKDADFVTLFLYIHRVSECEPGVYRWDGNSRRLQQLHRGNVERVAAFLSLEQALAGNSCFTVSMVADLAKAAQTFGNRGYRYVYFEAGAIGQRLYLGAEALGWNATGIGAFYDDDVHRYLGFLEETDGSVSNSVREAERATLVILDSPTSRHAAAQERNSPEGASAISEQSSNLLSGESEPRANHGKTALPTDSKKLPQQVIYHFAVGRAIPDPRIED